MWRWDQQEPFGNNPADENPSGLGAFDLPLRLPGQHYDKETGLHYNYFRDYEPSLGIYKQSDLIGLRGGLNTYAYVHGQPLRDIDLFGLQSLALCANPANAAACAAAGVGPAANTAGNVSKAVAAVTGAAAQSGSTVCEDEKKDVCYERWDKEDEDCKKWTGFGHRWVQACKDRAAHRLRLCYRNGGTPDPDEPPVWQPDKG